METTLIVRMRAAVSIIVFATTSLLLIGEDRLTWNWRKAEELGPSDWFG
jgi:hypothetical protein